MSHPHWHKGAWLYNEDIKELVVYHKLGRSGYWVGCFMLLMHGSVHPLSAGEVTFYLVVPHLFQRGKLLNGIFVFVGLERHIHAKKSFSPFSCNMETCFSLAQLRSV